MPRTAVVIGASMGGMLAAAALARSVDEVIVLERDELPDEPRPRRGLPQGRHAHILLPSGRDAIDALVPGGGVRGRLLAAGARERGLTSGLVTLGPQGWYRRSRHHDTHPLLIAGRDLIDRTVRDAVLASATRVRIRRGSATGLLGTAERVTGVRFTTGAKDSHPGAAEESLRADLVVDASGRGTRVEHWLADLGITGVRKDVVDSGLVYATRVYRTPAGAENFPPAQVTADPTGGRPGRAGLLLPIEGDRWLVSLAGTRGGEPTASPEDFVPFALGLRHPLVGRLIAGAEPLTDVTLSRSTRNERRYFEKSERWPEGLVALGDAVATYNPVYGQGMSVAALGALELSRELDRSGIGAPGLARRVQRAAAKVVNAAWAMSVGQDQWFPGVQGKSPTLADRLLSAYVGRMTRVATGSYRVSAAMCRVTTLQADALHLLHPTLLLSTALGPFLPPLSGPPLTPEERKILNNLNTPAP
ncbi:MULTISPECIES: FAD-dependent oxidoreductase [Streptomyces]|uniref:Pyridine nucleotide-disulfide oxidoreductase n=1 Tax=Streptomyces caniscabiei TaxID=2746961 RepID=A0ABU4MMM8_9ACTN|nr:MULTISPECIES: pyridine nucleotide-disulfide oxidoreductase [Streptomyces]MBE4734405.1 pyridine nucleotide-disulfide oxidoreductase [Streptomyces caniscabiei]MBE4755276.1 pyridine nucleotide-disulfide oxidoreductase [Streptomyces caniscabiei]MBE4771356.1 pyridine nucleotide-disulfide oxidoreductase [Streptomyces caniscabiei]MBE4783439.1 pyridine nucleotide-disulfide oxidoreductase [Streptomyces caniscabiei]MBE4792743.1 pyridine nucleotide-disulfide oxidoreductase [Streptomyces caniscabiei]